MLSCVNVFLLVLVLHRQQESRNYSENAREDAITVLWNTCRIELDRELLPEEMELSPMVVQRDQALEQSQAAALLGELTATPSDSMRYEGTKGTAQFYINGAFSAEFYEGAYPVDECTPEEFAPPSWKGLESMRKCRPPTPPPGPVMGWLSSARAGRMCPFLTAPPL